MPHSHTPYKQTAPCDQQFQLVQVYFLESQAGSTDVSQTISTCQTK